MNRRGFLGTLFGALMAPKIVGPIEIPDPSPEIWRAAQQALPEICRPPFDKQLVTLQTFVAEVTRITREELSWHRMEHWHEESFGRGYHRRVGDTVMYVQREPPMMIDRFHDCPLITTANHVNLIERASIEVDLEALYHPYDMMRDSFAEPTAYALAEQIGRCLKSVGGADVMVSADLSPEAIGFERSAVISRGRDLGMRGGIYTGVPFPPWPGPPRIYLDMLFGFGNAGRKYQPGQSISPWSGISTRSHPQ